MSSRYRSRILIHPAASGEGVLRNGRNAVLNIPVHVLDVGNRRVIGIPAVVVIVVDGGVIEHRVGVVHPRKVTLARLVRREIRLTRTQREPSYRRSRADGKAQAETGAASSSANPRHQRRRIDGSHAIRSGYPAPAAAKGSPAAIVIRSESPRCVVHPGPTPGRDPGPMPVMIGRPACGDRSRHPHLAIAGLIAPAAVLIQVVIAGHFAGNVTRRLRLVFPAVARGAPLVPCIGSRSGCEVVVDLIVAPHDYPLARIDRERLPSARHLTLPIANRDDGGLGIGIGVDAVFAGTKQSEGQVGRVDLENLILREIAHADRERPFRKPDLHGLVVQVQKLERRVWRPNARPSIRRVTRVRPRSPTQMLSPGMSGRLMVASTQSFTPAG